MEGPVDMRRILYRFAQTTESLTHYLLLVFGACPSRRIKAAGVAAVSYPRSVAQRG